MSFESIVSQMLKVHKAKNNDYSPEGKFGNFSESERIGVEAWRGAFVRLQDKYTRACNLIWGKEQMVQDEKLEDTLLDLANYAVIVLCLLQSRETVEPEKNFKLNDCAYRPNNCTPSDMPYAEIPVTEQEDEAWELCSVRRDKEK